MSLPRKILRTVVAVLSGMILLTAVSAILFRPVAERFAIREIKTYIEPLCGCTVTIDDLQIQYAPLGIAVSGFRAKDGLGVGFEIDSLSVRSNLRSLLRKHAVIEELMVSGGAVRGVGDQSLLRRTLDELNRQQAPEPRPPSSFTVTLERVKLDDIDIEDERNGDRFTANGLTFEAVREQDGGYRTAMTVSALSAARSTPSTSIELGRMEARALVSEKGVAIDALQLVRDTPWVSATGSATHSALNGVIQHDIDFAKLGLGAYVDALARGKAIVSGTPNSPMISGSVIAAPERGFALYSESQRLAYFDTAEIDYAFRLKGSVPEIDIRRLQAFGMGASIALSEPLTISEEALRGSFGVALERFVHGNVRLENARVEIHLGGNPKAPRATGNLTADRVGLLGDSIGPLKASADYRDGKVAVTAQLSPERGKVNAAAEIDLQSKRADRLHMRIDALPYPFSAREEKAKVWASAEFSGPLTVDGLRGGGTLRVASPKVEASGDFRLADGKLSGAIADTAGSAKVAISADLAGARHADISMSLTAFDLDRYATVTSCGTIDMEGSYRLPLSTPREGEGSVLIKSFRIGCGKQHVSLPAPHRLTLRGERVEIGTLSLEAGRNTLTISGVASPAKLNIKGEGEVELAPFSPLIPAVDEIGGRLTVAAEVVGSPTAPSFRGTVELEDGELLVGSAKVEAEDIAARLTLDESTVRVERMTGTLNGGSVTGEGIAYLRDPDRTAFTLRGTKVEYAPVDGSELTLNFEVGTSQLGSTPIIRGKIDIEEGTYERTIDMRRMVAGLTEWFEKRDPAPLAKVRALNPEGGMALDVRIEAPNQLFLLTNFAQSELSGIVHVGGTTRAPIVKGGIEIITGFVVIGSRQLELTSGRLDFAPNKRIPDISLRGEASVVTPDLEQVNILMTVGGPLNDPKVVFSSDTGLSQQEIISLLTLGRGSGLQSVADAVSKEAGLGAVSLKDRGPFGFRGIADGVGRLDRLTIEPRFNVETGAVEPTVIAAERVARRLSLQAETTFTRAASRSQLQAVFGLTRQIELLGTVVLPGSSEPLSLALDVALSLIKPAPPLTIRIRGNNVFPDDELLRGIRLTETSRVLARQAEAIGERIRRFYVDRAFFDVQVGVECVPEGEHCKSLRIDLTEGKQSRIREVRLQSEDLPPELAETLKAVLPKVGGRATADTLKQATELIRTELRKAWYLRARVRGSYMPGDRGGRIAVIDVRARRPIRITLRGNKSFKDATLFGLVDLENRRFPFGRNVAITLSDQIRSFYGDQGFIGTEVERIFEGSETELAFTIDIREGFRRKLQGVEITLSEADRKELEEVLGTQNAAAIFKGLYFVAGSVDQHTAVLKEGLAEIGYPEADIQVEQSDASGGGVALRYVVEPGRRTAAAEVEVVGLPDGVQQPKLPSGAFSPRVAERYREEFRLSLRDSGFLEAEVKLQADEEFRRVVLRVLPGEPTRIISVSFSGLRDIKEEVVRDQLLFREGDRWDAMKIGESRQRITALGLFSRVDIVPRDGELNSTEEGLIVSVIERDLESLTVGGGADSKFGVHVFGEGVDRSLFKDGRSITARADLYYDPQVSDFSKGVATLRFTDPELWDHKWTEDLSYRKLTRTTQEFDLARTSFSSSLHRSFDSGASYTVGHTLLRESLDNVPPDVVLSDLDTGSLTLSLLSASLSYDRRDDLINTRRGFLITVEAKVADEAIGADASFLAFDCSVLFLRPLPFLERRFTIANSMRAASQWTYGGTDEVPISQRYYLGGRGSVRGFRENSLGPRGVFDHVVGGDRLFSNSLELRYLIRDQFSVHTFLDAGNVFLSSFDDNELRFSSGFGFRYLSPVGPIGLDLGAPVDRRADENPVRLHFSLGSTF